jgi:hypothetical protein
LSFDAARENFETCAREGIEARMYWPGVGDVPVTELLLRRLLPMARAGLDRWGVDAAVSDRLLGVIEGRCLTGVNGAVWQSRRVAAAEASGADRDTALHQMLADYCRHMHRNDPVHTWPLL